MGHGRCISAAGPLREVVHSPHVVPPHQTKPRHYILPCKLHTDCSLIFSVFRILPFAHSLPLVDPYPPDTLGVRGLGGGVPKSARKAPNGWRAAGIYPGYPERNSQDVWVAVVVEL